ncbi:hypothetical protein Q8F55_007800 [Vanrija albida]|uniref:Uncharacterized protein n=1 Tax=Vanrija albida TaxID=181172 RepID=A0ABR3PVG3_9TREE
MENYYPAATPLDLASFAKKRRRRADSMPSTPREREFKTLKTLKDENASGLSRSNSTRARLLSPVQAYPSPQASPVLEGNALGLSGVQPGDDGEPRFGLGLLSPSA